MYIPQIQLKRLREKIVPRKVVIIYGPRRTGKTTLIEHFLESEEDYLLVNGEDIHVQSVLSSQSIQKLKDYVGTKSLLVIDEAQKIPNVGANLKLIVDHIPHLKVVVTGSSAFDLFNHLGEPLTGRKRELKLFPLSQMEIQQMENPFETTANLEKRLIYGSYPEVILEKSDDLRRDYLLELVSDLLFKDLLTIDQIKKPTKIVELLQLIAFQIGKEVSHQELGTQLGLNKETVERYLDLLQKVFVLVNIRGFSRNLRSEVTKTSRYYFYDNGIRNALIKHFNPLHIRKDVGELWENYLVMERLKKQHYTSVWVNNYFWRTYDQKELDWIEEKEGHLAGFEFKWSEKKGRIPKLWTETYPEATVEVISQNNYLEFIT